MYKYSKVIFSQSLSCFPTDKTYMSYQNLKQISKIIILFNKKKFISIVKLKRPQ